MAPVRPHARVAAIDALRGLALLGILTENLLTQFRVSPWDTLLPAADRLAPPSGPYDAFVARLVSVVIETKAMTLFALLFGFGIAAQRERVGDFGSRMARRLGFLLVLGLLHMFLLWSGDILALYAVAGIIAVLLSGLPTLPLLLVAVACLVVHELPVPYPPPFTSFDDMLKHAREAQNVAASGSFVENVLFRLEHPRPILAPLLQALPRTVGLFLIGVAAWRSRLAWAPRSVRLAHAVGIIAVGALLAWSTANENFAALVLALGYAASLISLHAHARVASGLASFAHVGRMTLTSYLVQSVTFGALFGAWGLGLYGRWGQARAATVGILVFAAQVLFASFWLRRYRWGPVEWLWRSVTLGAWQPLRRDVDAS